MGGKIVTTAGTWGTIRLPRDLYDLWQEVESRVAQAMRMPPPLTPSDRKEVFEAIASIILGMPESILRSEVGE